MQLLLIEKRPAQPMYVVNPDRASAQLELRSIGRIRDELLPRLPDRALLAPFAALPVGAGLVRC
jgi:7-cyano-7-deazaguanine synthase